MSIFSETNLKILLKSLSFYSAFKSAVPIFCVCKADPDKIASEEAT